MNMGGMFNSNAANASRPQGASGALSPGGGPAADGATAGASMNGQQMQGGAQYGGGMQGGGAQGFNPMMGSESSSFRLVQDSFLINSSFCFTVQGMGMGMGMGMPGMGMGGMSEFRSRMSLNTSLHSLTFCSNSARHGYAYELGSGAVQPEHGSQRSRRQRQSRWICWALKWRGRTRASETVNHKGWTEFVPSLRALNGWG